MSRVTVNRVLLGLAGLVLLVGALLVLAGGLDLYRVWHLGQPSWWPLHSPHHPVLSEAARTRWRSRAWWWPVMIGVLTLVAALAFGWLFAQLRRSVPTELALPTPQRPGLTLRLRRAALIQVLEAGAGALPEVARARVRRRAACPGCRCGRSCCSTRAPTCPRRWASWRRARWRRPARCSAVRPNSRWTCGCGWPPRREPGPARRATRTGRG